MAAHRRQTFSPTIKIDRSPSAGVSIRNRTEKAPTWRLAVSIAALTAGWSSSAMRMKNRSVDGRARSGSRTRLWYSSDDQRQDSLPMSGRNARPSAWQAATSLVLSPPIGAPVLKSAPCGYGHPYRRLLARASGVQGPAGPTKAAGGPVLLDGLGRIVEPGRLTQERLREGSSARGPAVAVPGSPGLRDAGWTPCIAAAAGSYPPLSDRRLHFGLRHSKATFGHLVGSVPSPSTGRSRPGSARPSAEPGCYRC